VHLWLDREAVEFFKAGSKGHITRMQAVLRAYVDAQKRCAGVIVGRRLALRLHR
jgi:hypothetical protein